MLFKTLILPKKNREFNRQLKRQRVVVENAFGLFKGKFKRFNVAVKNGDSLKNVRVLKCAIFIHNFLIDWNLQND